jgi:DNA recombination protein RmuC
MGALQLVLVAMAGLAVGSVVTWMVASSRVSRTSIRLEERERELAQHRANLEQVKADCAQATRALASEVQATQRKLSDALQQAAAHAATLESERQVAKTNAANWEQIDTRLRDAVVALSTRALQVNNQTFIALAKSSMGEFQQAAQADLAARQQSIDQLVKPVHEGLVRVDEQLQAIDKERVAHTAALHERLRAMVEGQQQLTSETELLVNALRTPHVRGQWGEMQLERVVELAGMLEHCDFTEQATVHGTDGALRPDLIVHLPGNKSVVVDAKTPLGAYLDAMNATDDDQRSAQLDRHARQVRDHIESLANKNYPDQFSEAVDFVVMFLPGESLFSAACQHDPDLIAFAVSRGVIPASPTTLITLLKAVYHGWQQERIARNAGEIRDLGADLYRRMYIVAEHLAKMHKGLTNAVEAYNAAVGSLELRVLPTVRKFRELGIGGDQEEMEGLTPLDTLPRLPAAPELAAD